MEATDIEWDASNDFSLSEFLKNRAASEERTKQGLMEELVDLTEEYEEETGYE